MINIYSPKEIAVMQKGGKILARILKLISKKVRPGITTEYLNRVAEDLIFSFGARPSFKGFNNYPAALCTSINDEIVHAIPGKRILQKGDILSLDLGIRYRGFCTDAAITVPIGKVSPEAKKLIQATKKCLELAIGKIKVGNYLEDIGSIIETHAQKCGFNVIRELVGHGVGRNVHEDPQILNYRQKERNTILKPGMVLAIEPMLALGDFHIRKSEDGFGYKTLDHSLAAHFEHTVAVTRNGPRILTINH